MTDDHDYASVAISILRRVSKSEAGWLARTGKGVAGKVGLSLMLLLTHAEVGAVRVSTAQSAQLPRVADARCPHDARTGAPSVELTVWDVLSTTRLQIYFRLGRIVTWRRSCISQHGQDLAMDQTLITMALVFFTGEQTVVLSSLLVAARRIVDQVDILTIWLGVNRENWKLRYMTSHHLSLYDARVASGWLSIALRTYMIVMAKGEFFLTLSTVQEYVNGQGDHWGSGAIS
ncbi:hypothetical protein BGY98DRAFT_932113 [Russula aff. rugulosa BPL654]|nr:hypothetical protein BGY98DRAFT_932113 [Russula aff. rugulosa BPL654]